MLRSPDAVVLDASVVTKWYLLDEPLADEARRIQAGYADGSLSVAAPHIVRHELASALAVAVWTGRIDEAVAALELQTFMDTDIGTVGDPGWLIADAFAVSQKHRVSLYDSMYLALAQALEVPLVTADTRFLRTVGDSASVVMLGEAIA